MGWDERDARGGDVDAIEKATFGPGGAELAAEAQRQGDRESTGQLELEVHKSSPKRKSRQRMAGGPASKASLRRSSVALRHRLSTVLL